ncbi:FecR family protein [Bordetella genomosp. 12]|uniref:Iron dicitrate transport regulator FecR n=1 Tax=Bordetella genomosp. 12 TaxID=463035 RepID=A0A261VCT6_9BORD|nr:FecR family protein [Bordetella genomosp. 12]OZI71581.1 iron dicitrate transport regulator FecR [Bordetella genomosp. 12]
MAIPEQDPVYFAALEWLARLNDEDVAEKDKRGFTRWLDADPAHPVAYARAQALWNRFEMVRPAADRMRRRRAVLTALAGVATLPVLYALSRQHFLADYRTGVGENRRVVLADGSTMELGSDTAVSVQYSERQRLLTLHRGQAYFQVAANAGRRFSVQAADGVTTALGTQFDVKILDDLVTVSVTEHAVAVQPGSGAQAVTVEAGWQMQYGKSGGSAPVHFDPAAALAWRQGRLVFNDVPLATVLDELQRYQRGPIFLMDAHLGGLPVTAAFNATDPQQALRGLAETFPIRLRAVAGYATLVYAR